jgi:hypothetical protein
LLKIKRFIVREEGDVGRRKLKILSKREERQKGKKINLFPFLLLKGNTGVLTR